MGLQLYEYGRLCPVVKFCVLQICEATGEPAGLRIRNSTFPFVRPPAPVSATLTETGAISPGANVDGAVAEEVNAIDELTVMLPADAFQFHSCPVAPKTPACTV